MSEEKFSLTSIVEESTLPADSDPYQYDPVIVGYDPGTGASRIGVIGRKAQNVPIITGSFSALRGRGLAYALLLTQSFKQTQVIEGDKHYYTLHDDAPKPPKNHGPRKQKYGFSKLKKKGR